MMWQTDFSPEGRWLATACDSHRFMLWDLHSGNVAKEHFVTYPPELGSVVTLNPELEDFFGGPFDSLKALAFSPSRPFLAVGGHAQVVSLWDLTQETFVHHFPGNQSRVDSLIFSRDGQHLAVGWDNRLVQVWDVDKRTLVHELTGEVEDGQEICFSKDDRYLITFGHHNSISQWDRASGLRTSTSHQYEEDVYTAAFSPDGSLLATDSYEDTIRIWEVKNHKLLYTLEGKGQPLYPSAMAFSPDNRWLVSNEGKSALTLWELATRTRYRSLPCATSSAATLTFSQDGQTLAVSGGKHCVLWNFGQLLREREKNSARWQSMWEEALP